MLRIGKDGSVILSSGYNEQGATNGFVGKSLTGFLQKPYKPSDLIRKIRKVIVLTKENDTYPFHPPVRH